MNRRAFTQLAALLSLSPVALLDAAEGPSKDAQSGLTARPMRRLILVELAGANDGLNTIVPYRHHNYQKSRPTLALNKHDIIELDTDIAANKALKGLDAAWTDGDLAIVQGLGYPSPDRSHFRSIRIWNTGGDGNTRHRNGWLTDSVEQHYKEHALDAHGISLDARMGVFAGAAGSWLNLKSIARLPTSMLFQEEGMESTRSSDNPALSLVHQQQQLLNHTINRIGSRLEALDPGEMKKRIGGHDDFAEQLRQVLALMQLDVAVPVLKVSLGSFDTHQYQRSRHDRLLRQLGKGLRQLRKALIENGQWNDTLIMTYSEFGRRVLENRSQGTDHGTAAPHFLLGGNVKGGLVGKHPSLDTIVDDDLQFTMDYRALYQHVLADWFGASRNPFDNHADSRLTILG